MSAPRNRRLPALPVLLNRKLYKTGQTRGADDDEVFQNRVSRNSTALLRYSTYKMLKATPAGIPAFENGFIVLLTPDEYFSYSAAIHSEGLQLGNNALVFYQTRGGWTNHNPDLLGWQPATSRTAPLGGQYVARVAGTTQAGDEGGRINRGFNTTALKGAGIRDFEYASADTIEKCRVQLEAIFWSCQDAIPTVVQAGMLQEAAEIRRTEVIAQASSTGLFDTQRLQEVRILNRDLQAVCPLCLKPLLAQGFLSKEAQAEGRDVHNLTVTQISLFHIGELRVGKLEHREYNLGWGHHFCNTVVKDAGIANTLLWMKDVLESNADYEESLNATVGPQII